MAIAKAITSAVNPKLSEKESSRTLDVRTNLYPNKKFTVGESIKKGNASPVTTHSGRISVGVNGTFWSGQLNAFSVYIDEDQDWSSVMYDENSPASGLVGIVAQMLIDLGVLGEEPTEEEIANLKQDAFFMDASFELPWGEEDVLDLRDKLTDEGTHHLLGTLELSVGIKGSGDDVQVVVRGSFLGDQQIKAGKVTIVESNNKVVIGRAYSAYARSEGTDPESLKSAFRAGLKSQRQKTLERRTNCKTRRTTAMGLEGLSAIPDVVCHEGLPPVC